MRLIFRDTGVIIMVNNKDIQKMQSLVWWNYSKCTMPASAHTHTSTHKYIDYAKLYLHTTLTNNKQRLETCLKLSSRSIRPWFGLVICNILHQNICYWFISSDFHSRAFWCLHWWYVYLVSLTKSYQWHFEECWLQTVAHFYSYRLITFLFFS